MVSRRTSFLHQQFKRRRLSTGSVISGGRAGGPAGDCTGTDGAGSRAAPPGGLDAGGGGGGGGAREDWPSGPDHTAEEGAAACSEDSPLRADQDVGQADDDDRSSMASTDVESDDSTTAPPAAFVVEDPAEPVAEAVGPIGPTEPVMQDAVSSNEVQLPVAQFGECVNDFALFTYAVNHEHTEDAFADLLKLGGCQAEYRTPFLMRKFIEASVNVEKRQVGCCLNGCEAFTHKRTHLTSCCSTSP